MTDQINDEIKKILLSRIPMNKLGNGDDVSNSVAFLAQMQHLTLLVKLYMLMEACIWLDKVE